MVTSCTFKHSFTERIVEIVYVDIHDLQYNAFNVYCRELAPGTVSLTGDRANGRRQ